MEGSFLPIASFLHKQKHTGCERSLRPYRIEVCFLTCLSLLALFHAEAFFAASAAINPSIRT